MRGFTLLELVVVVAVLGILLGIALPSYRQHLVRVHRTEAISALLGIAHCQEQVFAWRGRYDTTRCLPADMDRYQLRQEPPDAPESLAFTAWADPVGAQIRDRCGSLGIDQTGRRQVSGDDADADKCWRGGN